MSDLQTPDSISAQAAYAAHLQDRFWEMADRLYDQQAAWSESPDPSALFVSYAEDLGLDTERFAADLTAPDTVAFVEAQKDAAHQAGLYSTPSFFLNGEKVQAKKYEEFLALIETALAEEH